MTPKTTDYPPTTTGELFIKSDQSLGPLLPVNLVFGVFVLTLNSFVIHHYYRQKGRFVPSMYILISTADCSATISLFVQYLVLWLIEQDRLLKHHISYLVTLSVATSAVFWKVSVFSNVVLSVTRTIKIRRPFQRIKAKIAYISIGAYVTFWTVLALLDVIILVKYDDKEALDTFISYPWIGSETANWLAEEAAVLKGCSHDDDDCYNELLGRSILLTLLALAYLLPVLIVLVCMTMQIWSIRRPGDEVERAGGANNQHHVTVTILQITVLFFVCHSAATVWYLCTDLLVENHEELPSMIPGYRVLHGAIYTMLPLSNAMFSPVIIICRSGELRTKIRSMCTSFSCSTRTDDCARTNTININMAMSEV